jgi:predicted LPLAT superfamily acyltransferase
VKLSVKRGWNLRGWDTFAGESYLVGRYFTEAGARRAAKRYLRRLEKDQPAAIAGPIQDKVYVVRPDGSEFQLP